MARAAGSRLADVGSLAVVVATAAAHVRFVLLDARAPRDMGLYYRDLPDLYAGLGDIADLPALLADKVDVSGIGYELALAAWLRLVGRSPLAFQAVDVAWLVVELLALWAVARRVAGPAAGLGALLLGASMPILFVNPRVAWIHTPETALVLVAVWLWLGDRALARGRTAITLGLLGAATILLRPSGLVWFGLLAPVLLAPGAAGARRWRRIGAVWACWVVAAVPLAWSLPRYLAAKVEAHDRYLEQVPEIGTQLFAQLGALGLFVSGAGAAVALARRPRLETLLPLAWLASAVALWAGSRAGVDNFPLLGAGLALLGAWGLVRWTGLGALVALPGFLLAFLPQWLSAPAEGSLLRRIPGAEVFLSTGHSMNFYRPYPVWGAEQVVALLEATCPDKGAWCNIVVDQGLFYPYLEESGALGLFLLGQDRVKLHDIRQGREALEHVAPLALASFDCGLRDHQWRERYPESLDLLFGIIQANSMTPAWSGQVDVECRMLWFTPLGRVVDPRLLPPGDQSLAPAARPADVPMPGSAEVGGLGPGAAPSPADARPNVRPGHHEDADAGRSSREPR